MGTTHEVRRRIKSVKNIAQVTRAMAAVSTYKARHAHEAMLATRPYAQLAWKVLNDLAHQVGADGKLHPLFETRPVQTIGIVLITGNRGLCGAFNHNLAEVAIGFIHQQQAQAKVITIGKKGRDELMLQRGVHIVHEFSSPPAVPGVMDVAPIARAALDGFRNGEFDLVHLIYASFVNTLTQTPTVKQLLPLTPTGQAAATDYIYEPSPSEILDVLVPRFTELQIYQAILESLASEHSARMVAMRNATDNAEQLVGDLTLHHNKARQQGITSELLDIAGGAEALAQAQAARWNMQHTKERST
jgi:F-type H+-transporting ATPase subunit gamma